MYKGFMLPEKTLPVNSIIPLCDRISHLERMVLSFIAEYSLPFSSFRNFVEWAKKMMRNPEPANNLQVARQTAARFSQRARKAVNRQIERRFFSFNIDEATSSNLHKVLTLLVSYFCTTRNEVVVEHLGSLTFHGGGRYHLETSPLICVQINGLVSI